MLVDRSLRSMAALTTFFAVILIGIGFSTLGKVAQSPNLPLSWGGPDSCTSIQIKNTVSILSQPSNASNSFYSCRDKGIPLMLDMLQWKRIVLLQITRVKGKPIKQQGWLQEEL